MDLGERIQNYCEGIEIGLSVAPSSVRLCHYTSPTGLEGIVKTKRLWFTHSLYLNDSTEGTYVFKLVDSCLGDRKLDENFVNEVKLYVLKQGNRTLLDKIKTENFTPISNTTDAMTQEYFICSFSTNNDNLAMWNYYTKTPTSIGYCVEFDAVELLHSFQGRDCADGVRLNMVKVVYDEEEQLSIIKGIINAFNGFWCETEADDKHRVIEELCDMVECIRFAFKHPAFKFEEEINKNVLDKGYSLVL